MNGRMILALLQKDLRNYFRNRFFAFVTVLGLVFYVVIYFAMPAQANETLSLIVLAEEIPAALQQADVQGLVLERAGSLAALQEAVLAGDYPAGVVIPPELPARLAAGERGEVQVYFSGNTATELREAIVLIMQEVYFAETGRGVDVAGDAIILGPDTVGEPVALRDRLIPLLVVAILATETLGLASLISEEVETRTIRALLVTPLTVSGLFLGKGILGVGMAFAQTALLLLVTGALGRQPLVILAALLLGAVLVTGLGFLLAALGRDLMSVMAWGIPAILLLTIPAVAVLIPGFASGWVEAIPSYYLANTLHLAANLDVNQAELGRNLLILLAFDVVFVAAGVLALQRRMSRA